MHSIADPAALASEADDVGEHEIDIGSRIEDLRDFLQVVGFPAVVGVEEARDIGVDHRQPALERHHLAAVFAADKRHPRVVAVALAQEFRRAVGGAIVDDDNLFWRTDLRQCAVYRFSNEREVVVTGDDDRERGAGHAAASSSVRRK